MGDADHLLHQPKGAAISRCQRGRSETIRFHFRESSTRISGLSFLAARPYGQLPAAFLATSSPRRKRKSRL
jgi:hypothetical protein